MNKEIIEFLKSINDGKVSGSKRKIARLLDVSDTAVSMWCKQEKKPSIDSIEKMAKIFNRSKEEIEKIFVLSSDKKDENKNEFYEKELALKNEKIDILEKQIKFFEQQVSFYKEKISSLEKN